ncbi:MAG: hypothetical protein KC643_29535 [Nitrospira sp.]|nr:hypothetical protein [Nitrospira sp.]
MSKQQTKLKNSLNVSYLESPPQPEWILEIPGPKGTPLFYVRFQATGLLTRRIGPFPSRAIALGFLDKIVKVVYQELDSTFHNLAQEYIADLPFHARPHPITVEGGDIFSALPGSLSEDAFRTFGEPKKRKKGRVESLTHG